METDEPAPSNAPVNAPINAPLPTTGPKPIVFAPGTGDGSLMPPRIIRQNISCAEFMQSPTVFQAKYPSYPITLSANSNANAAPIGASSLPPRRLDPALLSAALAGYAKHICSSNYGSGPQQIIVVDYAKRSNEPRLYRVDLKTGEGVDNPVLVAHGKGSDRDDDGYADMFSNVQDSLMSSLGSARGAEAYLGGNGRSLRLDGLDYTNNQMRQRYIVVHSYPGDARRYFSAGLLTMRNSPGRSDGCFVVEPDKRDWLIDSLANGGFIYAGLSGERGRQWAAQEAAREAARLEALRNAPRVIFVSGTGSGNTTQR